MRLSQTRLKQLEQMTRERARPAAAPLVKVAGAADPRESLEAFVTRTMPDFEWNWHHRLICRYLEKLERGEIRRLMIFAPPRSGKSELVSRRFPAWAMGRHPDWPVISGTHTTELAGSLCGKVQDIIDSPEYQEIFPGVTLGGKEGGGRQRRRTQRVFQMGSHAGEYRGAGTRSRISGFGFRLGILDDPIGDADDAFSVAYRNRIWNWYNTTYRSRKNADNRILLTVTRWHADDLPGRLLRLAEENPLADQWTVLRIPALAEGPGERHPEDPRQEGEPLWPARVGQFDAAGLAADRASMPLNHFLALMQQRPTAAEGAVFKEAWFGTWCDDGVTYRLTGGWRIPRDACHRIIVVDPAATDKASSDYTAIGVFAIGPAGDVLVLDMIRERLAIEDVSPRVKLVWDLYRPMYIALEGVGFQRAMGKLIRDALPHVDLRLVDPQGKHKLVRALPAVARAESGKVYLPTPAPGWVRPFLEEVCSFTGNNDLHDDQVDVLSYTVQLAGGAAESVGMPLIIE